MQISSNYSTPNFQARIKLKAPNTKQILQASLGTAILGTASASAADVGVSIASNSEQMQNSFINSGLPKEVLDSHEDFLTSAGGRYDAAGYVENIPVQSTLFPSSMAGSAASCAYAGSTPIELASGENLNQTKLSSKQAVLNSKEFSAKPETKNASAVSGLLSTMAGSLYSGFQDLDKVNASLPEASAIDEDYGQGVSGFSGMSLSSSMSTYAGLESSTIEENAKNSDDDKKLPS